MLLSLFSTLRGKAIAATKIPWFWRGLAVAVAALVLGVFAFLRYRRAGELARLRLERDRLKLKAEKAEYTAASTTFTLEIEAAKEEAVQARAELSGVAVALERLERAAEDERRELAQVANWAGLEKLQKEQRP